MNKFLNVSRRDFVRSSALGVVGTMSVPVVLSGCSGSDEPKLKEIEVTEILQKAVDGRPLKAGLVGCGGRGSGAACNFIAAGSGLTVTALGDLFPEKLDACRKTLKNKGQDIPDANCFLGFDAYQKVIDSGVDVVLLCTPPAFRPQQFEYAVEKGKHCFIEKPSAVDPVGARRVQVAGKKAAQQGLTVLSGLCWRYNKLAIETWRRIGGGAIGEIISAHVSRMEPALWHIDRKPEWSDMEYMVRNWPNFCWTSGDLIVEQFIHEIDQMLWFMGGKLPVRAEATGGRQRRVNGDMYDNFSVEYVFDEKNSRRALCTSRQIDGCDTQNRVWLYGTHGYTDCRGHIYKLDGTPIWEYDEKANPVPDMYDQEHIHFVNAIRNNKPTNDVERHVQTLFTAILGREAAYTGKFLTMDQIKTSELKLGPADADFKFGPVPGVKEVVPVEGTPRIS